jgi:hypothetical protein
MFEADRELVKSAAADREHRTEWMLPQGRHPGCSSEILRVKSESLTAENDRRSGMHFDRTGTKAIFESKSGSISQSEGHPGCAAICIRLLGLV